MIRLKVGREVERKVERRGERGRERESVFACCLFVFVCVFCVLVRVFMWDESQGNAGRNPWLGIFFCVCVSVC